jgi:SAM-dependent methyltransferase
VLDWDHNAYYHRLLLRQMPQRCRRVLDVGCGAGAFAARLAQRSEQVDALDRSAEMIEEAKRRTPGNLNCVLADVLADPLPGTDYDAIFSVSALHHMPLRDSLPVLEAALRPGGVLAAIALPRPDLRHELPAEIVAAAGHRLLGAMFLAKRSLGSNGGFAKDSTRSAMPVVMDPPRHLVVPKGLKQDLDAVTNGLTMPWSSGPVERRVNHKMIKRQMFGRAGLPLLPQACPAHCPKLTAARTLASSQPEPVNGAA